MFAALGLFDTIGVSLLCIVVRAGILGLYDEKDAHETDG
jgi:hypothetical protein